HKADIKDLEQIESYFKNVDVVFHLAAEPRVPISIENPKNTHQINVGGTVNVLEAARENGVDDLIFSSSAAVYGDQEDLPISEQAELNYKAPYGLHKIIGERYTQLYSEVYDIDTVSLRYFNVYGPRKTAEGGYPMVIPIFLRQKQQGKPLTIVGDGKQTRDYVHVEDVVLANITAWKSDIESGEVFNIGTGTQTSVNEIAAIVGGETTQIPEREGEIRFSEADIDKAREKLDWKPQVGFEEGMSRLQDWWSSNR
ncbi:MAG: NAD-dependent epimerase/dehydratase family protein, partial [Candidatus Paceibacteria bacterium]